MTTSLVPSSHIPHVMTLFDRRVDLARFLPDTPLYVMCREWMWNSPHRLPTVPDSNPSHQPHPFPPPTPLAQDPMGREIRLDIPKPHPPHTENQQELDGVLQRVSRSAASNCRGLSVSFKNSSCCRLCESYKKSQCQF